MQPFGCTLAKQRVGRKGDVGYAWDRTYDTTSRAARLYSRIMTSSIVNGVNARSACGRPAGNRRTWPAVTRCGWPATAISAVPSIMMTSASNAAVCSLRPSPADDGLCCSRSHSGGGAAAIPP